MRMTSDGRFTEQRDGLWLDKRALKVVTKAHVEHWVKTHKGVSIVPMKY